jgi:hypothetical protein
MPYTVNVSKEQITGAPPLPANWYTVQIKGFRPRASKDKESWSMNAELAIVTPTEYENRRVFVSLNTKMAFMWPDFVHATGLEMVEVQNENTGTEKADFTIPGVFEGADENPEDPSQWKYAGALLNATMEVELAEIPAKDGYKAKNEVRQFKCAVPNCTDKHSTNLIKS